MNVGNVEGSDHSYSIDNSEDDNSSVASDDKPHVCHEKCASDDVYHQSLKMMINPKTGKSAVDEYKAKNLHPNYRDITGEWEATRKKKAQELATLWLKSLGPTLLELYQGKLAAIEREMQRK